MNRLENIKETVQDAKEGLSELAAEQAKGRVRRVADSVVKGVAALGNKGGLLDKLGKEELKAKSIQTAAEATKKTLADSDE